MNTLVVYYSKTGNARKVAGIVINELDGCDSSELLFDEKANTIEGAKDPSGFDRVIMVCPIWAFSLSTPMKLYLKQYGGAIQDYSLIVTCGRLGLSGCVRNCVKAIGKQPLGAMKIRNKQLRADNFDIKPML